MGYYNRFYGKNITKSVCFDKNNKAFAQKKNKIGTKRLFYSGTQSLKKASRIFNNQMKSGMSSVPSNSTNLSS